MPTKIPSPIARLAFSAFVIGAPACAPAAAHEEPPGAQPADPAADATADEEVTAAPRTPSALPVAAADVRTLATGGLLMPGATFGLDAGAFIAFGGRYDRSRAVAVRSHDTRTFEPPRELPFVVGDVTGAQTSAGRALYLGTRAGVERLRVTSDGSFEAARGLERVVFRGLPAGVAIYWPQAVGLADGRVLLAFVEAQKRAFLAVSDASGLAFDVTPAPTPPGDLRGVLAHVGTTRTGAWVLTYQVADASWLFRSYVLVSRDQGRSWSAPLLVHETDPNVHDAYPIMREDEGADLYYLRAASPDFFSAHRRALRADGSLGPEQLVTALTIGHVEKPQPRRLPDGRIALPFAMRRGETTFDLALTVLTGDAPLR